MNLYITKEKSKFRKEKVNFTKGKINYLKENQICRGKTEISLGKK